MQFQCVTEATLARLVDPFYGQVRADPVLGPIFDKAIGNEGWPAHLAKMYAFWSSVMLTTGRYKGNSMAAHMAVQGIEEPMFKRWLTLFGETADEFFAEGPAAIFRIKAERIAESLKLGLFFRPAQPHRDSSVPALDQHRRLADLRLYGGSNGRSRSFRRHGHSRQRKDAADEAAPRCEHHADARWRSSRARHVITECSLDRRALYRHDPHLVH
jgi:hemoglobin